MALQYVQAAHVLDMLEARRGGIKTLVFQSDFAKKKLIYALVAETLKYSEVIEELMRELYTMGNTHSDRHWNDDEETAGIFDPKNKWIVRVMVHDLLFGSRKSIQGRGPLKASIARERSRLEELLRKRMLVAKVTTRKELIPKRLRGGKRSGAGLPRYARVNTLKTTLQNVQDAFDPMKRALAKAERRRAWQEAHGGTTQSTMSDAQPNQASRRSDHLSNDEINNGSQAKKRQSKNRLKKNEKQKLGIDKALVKMKESNPATAAPLVDSHVRNLLRFPAGKDLHNHPLVVDGSIILQDKSSCFSAQVLADSITSETRPEHRNFSTMDMIDACAAPGNKTSHLASLISLMSKENAADFDSSKEKSLPKIFAFDKSAPRLAVLQRRMIEAGADQIVHSTLQSFLDVDPADPKYSRVKAVLLDPSCSGSGMASRLDHFIDNALRRSASRDSKSGKRRSRDVVDEEKQQRLKFLSDFQKEALLHAFSFPNVRHVVYSTCSVFDEENEHVVAYALDHERSSPASTALGPFSLAKALPNWPRRGKPGIYMLSQRDESSNVHRMPSLVDALPSNSSKLSESHLYELSASEADCLVRVLPEEDETNGFFVALFQRGVVTTDLAQHAADQRRKKKRNAKRKQREKRAKKRRKAEAAAAAAVEGSDKAHSSNIKQSG